jgi:hypothetical protein
MNKCLVSAFIFLLAGSAQAASFTDCTNFTGRWIGSCEVTVTEGSGKPTVFTVARDLHIVQTSCKKISINGGIYFYTIGGDHTSTDRDENFTHNYTKQLDWNDDQTMILETELLAGRKVGANKKEVYYGVEHNTFKLENGKFYVTKDEEVQHRDLLTKARKTVVTAKRCAFDPNPN